MADLNLDDLGVFVRVVDRGGFAAAARELRAPTSTVSRAIGRLETRAGVRLLHRTTRNVQPTDEGRDLYEAVAPAVSTLRSAARTLEPASLQPRGTLRVTAPHDLGAAFLADVIATFVERYPLVRVDLALTNAHTDLVREGFDVAVRATGRLRDSSLVARKVGEIQHRLYASPRYLREHGAPTTWQTLADHRTVVFRGDELARTWALSSAAGDVRVPVQGRVGGDDFTFVRAMAIAGAGIALLPSINCSADEASGRLVRVLPEWHAAGASLYVVYPSTKNVPARVTAFRDGVAEAFAAWSPPYRRGPSSRARASS